MVWNQKVEVSEGNKVAGKTFIYWSMATMLGDHAAVYFGKDAQGNEYVITKNGKYHPPTLMKISDLPYYLRWFRTDYKKYKPLSDDEEGEK